MLDDEMRHEPATPSLGVCLSRRHLRGWRDQAAPWLHVELAIEEGMGPEDLLPGVEVGSLGGYRLFPASWSIWDEPEHDLRQNWRALHEKLCDDRVSYVVFGSGTFRSSRRGYGAVKTRARLAALLSMMLETSQDSEIDVYLEPLKPSECNVINSLRDALDVIEHLAPDGKDARRLGVVADVNHIWEELQTDSSFAGQSRAVRVVHLSAPDSRRLPSQALLDPLAGLVHRLAPGHVTFECEWTSAADFHQAWDYGARLLSRMKELRAG